MVVLELLAGVAVVLLVAVVWWMRIGRWRSPVQVCVSEEEARENAAPLTRAILPGRVVSAAGRERRGEGRRRFPAGERRRRVPVRSAQSGRLATSARRSARSSRCSRGAEAFETEGRTCDRHPAGRRARSATAVAGCVRDRPIPALTPTTSCCGPGLPRCQRRCPAGTRTAQRPVLLADGPDGRPRRRLSGPFARPRVMVADPAASQSRGRSRGPID